MADVSKKEIARKRVTVLFSGRGSNMASLIKASLANDFPAIVTYAISNIPDAGGFNVLEFHNIPSDVVDHKLFETRQEHEAEVIKLIDQQKPDLICLAGYMRILSENFVRKYRGKIINIHPSLLPSFKGVDTHHRAIIAGVKIHGASVHFVDETLDGGPIIAQAAVPVLANDTDDTLAERVLKAEHLLYPHALALVASGKIRFSANRAVFKLPNEAAELSLLSPALEEISIEIVDHNASNEIGTTK